jgi:hypothetical protein
VFEKLSRISDLFLLAFRDGPKVCGPDNVAQDALRIRGWVGALRSVGALRQDAGFWYAGAIFFGFIAQQYIFKSSFVGWFVD